jgi:hypothetical protein
MEWKLSGAPRQDQRSEVLAANPWQEQKPSVVDDQVQPSLALRIAPADPTISRRSFPSAGPKANGAQEAESRAHKVPDLRARQAFVAQVVKPSDSLVPQAGVCFGGHWLQA